MSLKVTAALKQRAVWSELSAEAWLYYWTVWPGMRLSNLRRSETTPDINWLYRGVAGMAASVALLVATVIIEPSNYVAGWIGVVVVLAFIHFGYADVLSYYMRLRGFKTKRLFLLPHKSKSLNDFWSRRWNVAFVEMNQVLFLPGIQKLSKALLVPLTLGLSGIMHELALSYPAGAGWGLPLLYFVVQGLLMKTERQTWFKNLPEAFRPWWARFWVLAPVGLVFHQPFRDALPLELVLLLSLIHI